MSLPLFVMESYSISQSHSYLIYHMGMIRLTSGGWGLERTHMDCLAQRSVHSTCMLSGTCCSSTPWHHSLSLLPPIPSLHGLYPAPLFFGTFCPLFLPHLSPASPLFSAPSSPASIPHHHLYLLLLHLVLSFPFIVSASLSSWCP